MKFSQAIKMALSSILSNKMRSFLTMLGIIIGILSVIILIAIGQGTKKQVADQIQSLGTNLITVSITGNRSVKITQKEIDDLKAKPGVKDIAPTITSNVNVKGGDNTAQTSLEATSPNYSSIRNVNVQSGRFIVQNDLDNRYRVALVGVTVLDELFNTRDALGKTISINGIDLKIVGILQEQGSTSAGSSDDRVIIPITTAQRLLKSKDIRTFYVQAASSSSVDAAMDNIQMFLMRKTNNNTKAFRVFNQTQLLSTVTQTNDNMTMMLGGIAGISLLVGGIGIMNIMLVSVTERTREIGVRKAIGAKRKDILIQFLIEAIAISGVGGLLGVLLGFAGSTFLEKFMKMTLVISPTVVISAFAFSATVGVVFGLYPANKASKLRPIDALRYE